MAPVLSASPLFGYGPATTLKARICSLRLQCDRLIEQRFNCRHSEDENANSFIAGSLTSNSSAHSIKKKPQAKSYPATGQPGDMKCRPHDLIYTVEDDPPLHLTILLALQVSQSSTIIINLLAREGV